MFSASYQYYAHRWDTSSYTVYRNWIKFRTQYLCKKILLCRHSALNFNPIFSENYALVEFFVTFVEFVDANFMTLCVCSRARAYERYETYQVILWYRVSVTSVQKHVLRTFTSHANFSSNRPYRKTRNRRKYIPDGIEVIQRLSSVH
jgi:hypothetical protein